MAQITIWQLSNCLTCQKILEKLKLNDSNSKIINIKEDNISQKDLEQICSIRKLLHPNLIFTIDLLFCTILIPIFSK